MKIDTVYLVQVARDNDVANTYEFCVEAVFSTQEKAEAYIREFLFHIHPDDVQINEMAVN